VVASLARHQKTIGHRVVVHALQGAGPLGTRLQAAGIPVFLNSLGSPLARFFRLLSLFRRHKPDVVHAHNIGAALLAAPAASLAGVPCIVVTRMGTPGIHRGSSASSGLRPAFATEWWPFRGPLPTL